MHHTLSIKTKEPLETTAGCMAGEGGDHAYHSETCLICRTPVTSTAHMQTEKHSPLINKHKIAIYLQKAMGSRIKVGLFTECVDPCHNNQACMNHDFRSELRKLTQ
jgi:hypothetical protein